MKRCWLLGLGVLAMALPALAAEPLTEASGPVRIGMMASIFRDVPSAMFPVLSRPFTAMMKQRSGLTGEATQVPDVATITQQLRDGHIHLAVYHGFEFAWARANAPDELEPLVVCNCGQPKFQAFLMVRHDQSLKSIAELNDKKIGVPIGTREHCRLFLDRLWASTHDGKQFPPAQMARGGSAESALDDVVDGVLPAALVDNVALTSYANMNPARVKNLRPALSSELFPLSVVVCRKGGLTPSLAATLKRSLIELNQSREGQNLMFLWKLKGFEAVPADFNAQLDRVFVAYPQAK
jgi:ABC-type phosphate/phosphonate transport system substrate-binding protein